MRAHFYAMLGAPIRGAPFAMFDLPPDTPLRLFAIAHEPPSAFAAEPARRVESWYSPTQAQDAPFILAMNRANCFAYDGTLKPGPKSSALGMPRWVMLDCCMLPSVVVGYEAPRDALPPELADAFDPEGRCAWIGVSEYIALPSVVVRTVVGVSLFSLVRGLRLGRRTKAVGLALMGACEQIGVAQWSNPAMRLHLSFGALELLATPTPVHSRPNETFVYRLRVPTPADLVRMATHADLSVRTPAPTHHIDPRSSAGLQELRALAARPETVHIVGAGPVEDGQVSVVELHVGSRQPSAL